MLSCHTVKIALLQGYVNADMYGGLHHLLRLLQVEKPKNLTALQLPQLDLPMPQKPQIDLPTVPAVPVYQFQLPDIKAEIQNLGQSAVDKIKSLTPQVL